MGQWKSHLSRGITSAFLWISPRSGKILKFPARNPCASSPERSKNSFTAKAEVLPGGNSRDAGETRATGNPGNRKFSCCFSPRQSAARHPGRRATGGSGAARPGGAPPTHTRRGPISHPAPPAARPARRHRSRGRHGERKPGRERSDAVARASGVGGVGAGVPDTAYGEAHPRRPGQPDPPANHGQPAPTPPTPPHRPHRPHQRPTNHTAPPATPPHLTSDRAAGTPPAPRPPAPPLPPPATPAAPP